MALVEEALVARLKALSAVTALVSTRIYPEGVKQGENPSFPLITFERTDTAPIRSMGGGPAKRVGVRLHIWATSYATAATIGAAVKGSGGTALDWYGGSSGGVTVHNMALENEVDVPDPDPSVFHRVLEFDVIAQES